MQKLRIIQPNGFWLVTITSIIWGTIGVATQAIYHIDSASPLFINLVRTLIATPILLFMSWRIVGREMFNIRRGDFLMMLITGIFLALSQVAYFEGIRYVGVTITTIITICIAPVLVALISVLFKLESLNRRTLLALICAILGCILLVSVTSPNSIEADVFVGTMYAMGSAGFYALMLLGGRYLAIDYHPLQVTSIGFSAGTIILLLINLMSNIATIQTSQGWLLVFYLGLIPTALAYWLFQIGLRSITATKASIVVMIDPLVAAFLAWVLFGETLTEMGGIGSGLLILSLFLLSAWKDPNDNL